MGVAFSSSDSVAQMIGNDGRDRAFDTGHQHGCWLVQGPGSGGIGGPPRQCAGTADQRAP